MTTARDPSAARTRSAAPMLLTLGASAGPLYIVAGILQMLLRDGFDPRRHALSVLSNGEGGWVQIANFVVTGALVLAGAVGCRQAIRARRAGTWGPILLGVFGFGLIASGIFRADPAEGFPPGSEAPGALTRDGLLHFVFGGVAFYALIAACFVFARRHFGSGRKGLAWYSIATGVGFFTSFAGIASGSGSPAVMIAFYAAVAWVWIWHTVVLVHVARDAASRAVESAR